MSDSTIGQIILLITTLGGFIVAAYRENRARRWATEDRAAATREIITRAAAEAEATRIKTVAIAESLRIEALDIAAQLREDARVEAEVLRTEAMRLADLALKEANTVRAAAEKATAELLAKVQEGTDAAERTYVEANNVNNKIENLNQRLMATQHLSEQAPKIMDAKLDEINKRGDEMVETADDTNERVRVIEKRGETLDKIESATTESAETNVDTNERVRTIEKKVVKP